MNDTSSKSVGFDLLWFCLGGGLAAHFMLMLVKSYGGHSYQAGSWHILAIAIFGIVSGVWPRLVKFSWAIALPAYFLGYLLKSEGVNVTGYFRWQFLWVPLLAAALMQIPPIKLGRQRFKK